MAKLNLYEDNKGYEFVVIITDKEFEDMCNIDYRLVNSVEIKEDMTLWPTDRFLVQD